MEPLREYLALPFEERRGWLDGKHHARKRASAQM
jgi:hypothetical protein